MTSLVVLGSGAAVPTPLRGPPGLVLKTDDGRAFLVDPGPGALFRAAKAGVAVEEIAGVFLTHHHPDHTLDVMSLLFARRSELLRPVLKELVLAGPAGTRALHERMVHLYGRWVEAVGDELRIVEIVPCTEIPPEAGLPGLAAPVKHMEGSIGYRFELADGTIALSGDSEPCEGLVELGRGADILLLESSVPDAYRGTAGHMSPSEAGEVAARAGCGMLVLYHLYPPVEESAALASAQKAFSGEVRVAADGEIFVLGSAP